MGRLWQNRWFHIDSQLAPLPIRSSIHMAARRTAGSVNHWTAMRNCPDHTPTARDHTSRMLNTPACHRCCLEYCSMLRTPVVLPCHQFSHSPPSLDRILRVNRPSGECRSFAFVLAVWWKHFRLENTISRTVSETHDRWRTLWSVQGE